MKNFIGEIMMGKHLEALFIALIIVGICFLASPFLAHKFFSIPYAIAFCTMGASILAMMLGFLLLAFVLPFIVKNFEEIALKYAKNSAIEQAKGAIGKAKEIFGNFFKK